MEQKKIVDLGMAQNFTCIVRSRQGSLLLQMSESLRVQYRQKKKKTEENVTVEAGPDKPYTIAMNFQSEQKNSSTV